MNALAVAGQPWLVYLVASTLLGVSEVRRVRLSEVLVLGGGLIGIESLFETLTRINLFTRFWDLVPLQKLGGADAVGDSNVRDGVFRASGSAQHPIALAVLFVLLLPLCVWLLSTVSSRLLLPKGIYIACAVSLVIGLGAAVSRTGLIALFVILAINAVLVPRGFVKVAVILTPVILLASAASPALSGFFLSVLDISGTIDSQSQAAGLAGQGRLIDLESATKLIDTHFWFGLGLGSRPTLGGVDNVLDNQYLGTLLETGVVGIIGTLLVAAFSITRAFRSAFTKIFNLTQSRLAFAIACSLTAYFVSMFFFDAFSFIQLSLIVAVSMALLPVSATEVCRTGKVADAF